MEGLWTRKPEGGMGAGITKLVFFFHFFRKLKSFAVSLILSNM